MRYIVAIVGLLLLIGSLVGVKAMQISSLIQAGAAFAKSGPPPETVSTDVARELAWEGTLSAVGSIAAAKGVSVSNDAPGVVKKISFDSGDMARPGQVLVELDSNVERAQLKNAVARLELAQQTATRTRGLVQSGVMASTNLERDDSLLKSAQAEVDGLKAQIDRKTVRAAFAGRLGIREVNLGQYLNPGTTLTSLESLESLFVDFTLPQQALGSISTGFPVRVGVASPDGKQVAQVDGTVAAIDPSLDPVTRSMRIRASLPNKDQKLSPGMFANVSVVLPKRDSIIAVPQTAVVHAPYGDSVFVVEAAAKAAEPAAKDAKAAEPAAKDAKPAAGVRSVRQQFVRLGEERGDFVAVLDGVKVGEEVVSSGAFKLRNGATIVVNNEKKPNPSVAPNVQNR